MRERINTVSRPILTARRSPWHAAIRRDVDNAAKLREARATAKRARMRALAAERLVNECVSLKDQIA